MGIVYIPKPIHIGSVIFKQNAAEYVGKAHKMYDALRQEDRNMLGQGVKIAVIDTGGDRHPDIEAVLIEDMRYGFHPTLNDGKYDFDGHGTHVASILFAKHNGYGVRGWVPEAEGFLIKALGDDGSGTASDIERAIMRAGEWGADYICMSLGADQELPEVSRAIEYVYSNYGTICFVAAGNDGSTSNRLDHPAMHPLTVSCGSHDLNWNRSYFSSNRPEPDMYFLGEKIIGCSGTENYVEMSGTSQATPSALGYWCRYHTAMKNTHGVITPQMIRDFTKAKLVS